MCASCVLKCLGACHSVVRFIAFCVVRNASGLRLATPQFSLFRYYFVQSVTFSAILTITGHSLKGFGGSDPPSPLPLPEFTKNAMKRIEYDHLFPSIEVTILVLTPGPHLIGPCFTPFV